MLLKMMTGRLTSIPCHICLLAIVIVAVGVGVGEGWPYVRPRPVSPHNRGGFRRPMSRYQSSGPRFSVGTEGSGRQRESLPRPPPLFYDESKEDGGAARGLTGGIDDQGDWLRMWVLKKHQNSDQASDIREEMLTSASRATVARHPPKRLLKPLCMGPIKCKVLDVIDVRRKNETKCKNRTHHESTSEAHSHPPHRETPPDQGDENPYPVPSAGAASLSRPNRRAYTASQEKIPCTGPRPSRDRVHEECYRFNVSCLAADLRNDSVISGALVLLPAGNSFGALGTWQMPRGGQRQRGATRHRNISIAAKFPTSGDSAFANSIRATNMPFNVPSVWQSAVLNNGPSLVARAVYDRGLLVLRITVITTSRGHAAVSEYVPSIAAMLPVLIVDLKFNGTDSPSTETTTESSDMTTMHENVVRPRLRSRRSLSRAPSPDSGNRDFQHIPPDANTSMNSTEPALRDVECTLDPDGNTCCQGTATIDLFDYGWDSVITPRVFNTAVCFCNCGGNAEHSIHRNSPYRDVFNHVLTQSSTQWAPLHPKPLSCFPTKTESLQVLVFNGDYDIIAVEVPDLIVRQCGYTTYKPSN